MGNMFDSEEEHTEEDSQINSKMEKMHISPTQGLHSCHKVPAAVRTRGDGMELPSLTEQITDSLPEEKNRKVSASSRNSGKGSAKRIHVKQPIVIGNKKVKEPKFVPYEPYKCAVKPIVPYKHVVRPALQVQMPKIPPAPPSVPKSPTSNNKEMMAELAHLKEEKNALEEQLKIQVQVNGELKKLLVASVGEDLEARVAFLTEDKAKLAHDVARYTEKLTVQHEERDAIDIQCDVWRTKFLASSLMVSDLARWKGLLLNHCNDTTSAMQALVNERSEIRSLLQKTCRNLHQLIGMEEQEIDGNIMDLAKLSVDISNTAVQKAGISLQPINAPEDVGMINTPAEAKVQEILSQGTHLKFPMEILSIPSFGQHRCSCGSQHAAVSYKCCPHCTGEVHEV